jgi:hypothetical protein
MPGSEYFKRPPDVDHPFYTEIMTDYIDLNIIERKFKSGDYLSTFAFLQDFRIMWSKTFKYMRNNPDIYKKAKHLSEKFDSLANEFNNFPLNDSKNGEGAIKDL